MFDTNKVQAATQSGQAAVEIEESKVAQPSAWDDPSQQASIKPCILPAISREIARIEYKDLVQHHDDEDRVIIKQFLQRYLASKSLQKLKKIERCVVEQKLTSKKQTGQGDVFKVTVGNTNVS